MTEEEVKDIIMEIRTCKECHKSGLFRLDTELCLMCKTAFKYTVLEKPCKNCNKVSALL